MASLTPLSKGLIALAVVGGMASAVWHLYLKENLPQLQAMVSGGKASPSPSVTPGSSVGAGSPGIALPDPAPVALPNSPPPAEQPDAQNTPAAAAAASPPALNSPSPANANANANANTNLTAEQAFEAGRKSLAASDFNQARAHLELALQQGSGGAACLLGEMTIKGQGGLTPDRDVAARLFQLAQSRNTICFTTGQ